MSRTMSGLGATGDVFLAGGTEALPQTFTGFNKFDKLTKYEATRPKLVPTAATTDPSANDFITRQDGDDLYASGEGDALLAGGEEASPQTFIGVNTFDSINLRGNVFTENGNGQLATPYRRTVLSNTITTEATGSKYVKIATIPASASTTKDFIKVVLTGGAWTAPPMIITAWFNNRNGFRFQYKKEGNIQTNISLFCVRPGPFGGTVEIWIFMAGGIVGGSGQYSTASWNIDSVEGDVFKYPTATSTAPTSTLLFDSNNATTSLPNIVSQSGGVAGHAFKAGFSDLGRFPPGATNYAWPQSAVFKPDVVSFDTGGCYNVGSGKFTAKIKGIYAFKFSAYTNETYDQFSRPTLFRNNIQWQTTGGKIGMNGNQVYSFIALGVGDYVTVKSAAGSLYMYSDSTHNQFSGSFICGYI